MEMARRHRLLRTSSHGRTRKERAPATRQAFSGRAALASAHSDIAPSADGSRVIELLWRQSAPGDWVAVLTDGKTGVQYEARSMPELEAVLKALGGRS